MIYKITHGYDHFNSVPLYRVDGVDNEYVGEWDKDMQDVIKERNDLEAKESKIDSYLNDNIEKLINLSCKTDLNHCKAVLVQTLSMFSRLNILNVKREVYIHKVLERRILRFVSEMLCSKVNEGYELSKLCNVATIHARRLIIECNDTFFLNKYAKSLNTQSFLGAFLYSSDCTFQQSHLLNRG